MKFKQSAYELIYDRFWNIFVNPLDAMIREVPKKSSACEININSILLIKKLTREVKQLFLSIDNPVISFEDPYSLALYRQNLVNKTLEYFSVYMKLYPQHQELTAKLLKGLSLKRNSENVVWLQFAN